MNVDTNITDKRAVIVSGFPKNLNNKQLRQLIQRYKRDINSVAQTIIGMKLVAQDGVVHFLFHNHLSAQHFMTCHENNTLLCCIDGCMKKEMKENGAVMNWNPRMTCSTRNNDQEQIFPITKGMSSKSM
ncbi:hypothetical protein QR680_014706 [Steinernema hermaphroditum]|uniref:RRM domain-containing protein n=1 Tax=Steinernema hermaphroditum TaxID=289476 RepID=A0AA39ICG0_9BILA|nr:hypothetical protein QR680_014706 [Steinernema hermaphroditum]